MTRALLVIDIQNDYFSGGALPLFEADKIEQRIVAAISKAKSAGDKVILVRHISPKTTGLFAKGETGNAIRPAILESAKDAPIIVKQVADSFQDTDLKTHLDGISELCVCGMMTQNCVAFTAMSRDADDYDIKVVSDLCTAPSEIVHLIALNALGSKRTVITSSDL